MNAPQPTLQPIPGVAIAPDIAAPLTSLVLRVLNPSRPIGYPQVVRALTASVAVFNASLDVVPDVMRDAEGHLGALFERLADQVRTTPAYSASASHPTLWHVAAMTDPTVCPHTLLVLLGAAYAEAHLSRPRLPDRVLRAMYTLACAGAFVTDEQLLALNAVGEGLLQSVRRRYSRRFALLATGALDLAEDQVQRRWRQASTYTDADRIAGVIRGNELSADDVAGIAKEVRGRAEAGDPIALLQACSFWLGLGLEELSRLRLLDASEVALEIRSS